jgi:hypothetical protein
MVNVQVTADEVIEAMQRGLVSDMGHKELTIAVLQLRLLKLEEELALERHQHQTTTEQLAGSRETVRALEDALRKPEHFEALPLATNGAT